MRGSRGPWGLRIEWIILPALCLAGMASLSSWTAAAQSGPLAVATFESLSLYWRPAQGAASRAAAVRYRPVGAPQWRDALPLWFDAEDREYRGSIVHLRPAAEYEIELSLQGVSTVQALRATTWSEQFPIAETILLPQQSNGTLRITRRGSPRGYILYTSEPGNQAVIDGAGSRSANIVISDSSYVIVRGLTLRDARVNSIRLEGDTHDIVIEQNDISGWGRATSDGWAQEDSGILSDWGEDQIERIIVQRNRIHHPRYDANAWTEARDDTEFSDTGWHPLGAIAVSFYDSRGNHVIRYNEIYSDEDHMFNDCIGAGENLGRVGFPHRDSDIYGNRVEHCWDDAIESEGGNMNVRIWGNYISNAMIHFAGRVTEKGPFYLWRNVGASSRFGPQGSWDADPRGMFFKSGTVRQQDGIVGGGAEYVFHNTILQPQVAGLRFPIGVAEGIVGSMVNQISRNNILDVYRSRAYSIFDDDDPAEKSPGTERSNNFDYDLYNGRVESLSWLEVNGINGTPSYNPPAQFNAASGRGVFTLDSSSPGYDSGMSIPNFNDVFTGRAPDMGAHEAGTPPMQFGVGAYLDVPPPYTLTDRATNPRERRLVPRAPAGASQ